MSADQIYVHGYGAVSPAGWTVSSFRETLHRREPIPVADLARPGWVRPLRVRQVPAANPRPGFVAHARLRRTSPIAHYAVSAALEALGEDAAKCANGAFRLGIIYCAMSGCVNYSRRFYDEVLKDPATASPLVFPETVYNSPASHVAALLGTQAISYTLVGDPGTYLQGLALAADWLLGKRVDGCLVVGAEEMDWLLADSTRHFNRDVIPGAGAGAIYWRRGAGDSRKVHLAAVTDSHLFSSTRSRSQTIQHARADLPGRGEGQLLCDSNVGVPLVDREEQSAWSDWAGDRVSPKGILGEGYMAGAAWQCIAAIDALMQNRYSAATVSVVGTNQQAIAAQFVRE